MLAAPKDSTPALPVAIPTSALFSYSTPAAFSATLLLSVPTAPKELKVSIQPDLAIASPRAKTGATIRLARPDGSPASGTKSSSCLLPPPLGLSRTFESPPRLSPILLLYRSGEVAVFIVNKAALDLKPLPSSTYAARLFNRYNAIMPMLISSYRRLALESGYHLHWPLRFTDHCLSYIKSAQAAERRMRANPWVTPHRPFYAAGLAEVDLTDAQYLYAFSFQPFPNSSLFTLSLALTL